MSGFGRRLLRFARGSAIDLPDVQGIADTPPAVASFVAGADDDVALGEHELCPDEFVVAINDDGGDLDEPSTSLVGIAPHPELPPPLLQIGTLALARGDVAILHAEAGAGSEQLIAQVLGLTSRAIEGVALWGHHVARLRPAAIRAMRQRIGVVPQRLQLLDRRSVFDNVALPLEIDGVTADELSARADELLQAFDLAKVAGRTVGSLSLAMQQRVAFARACIRRPELVLADHPTMHQDDAGVTFFADQLAVMRHLGATALVVTSDLRLLHRARAEQWAPYVLHDGLPVAAHAAARDVEFLFESVATSPREEQGAFAMGSATGYAG
ncbi:MAG: ATP-binding cassette domain-containing protein [Myxococcales bacterium]|nr:ATP-binding cassette domain-containing protein [Myxococcales bacterium]